MVILFSLAIKYEFIKIDEDIDEVSRQELKYWQSKANLIDEIDKYLLSKAPTHNLSSILLLKYSDKYKVSIQFILAQGFLESHFGTKGVARRTNSVWNVGAWDNGKITHIYNHPNESIAPYVKLLSEQYLSLLEEEPGISPEDKLLINFINKDGNRYASYPFYEKELKIILRDISINTKIDSLYSIYLHYKTHFRN